MVISKILPPSIRLNQLKFLLLFISNALDHWVTASQSFSHSIIFLPFIILFSCNFLHSFDVAKKSKLMHYECQNFLT